MSPIVVRYMTPEEEELFEYSTGIAEEFSEPKYIALHRGYSPKSMARTFAHELGHVRYPVEIAHTLKSGEETDDWESFHVLDLFRELCANYYTLRYQPRSGKTKWLIRQEKRLAREDGLTSSMIARVDRVARERVGFTGREVK